MGSHHQKREKEETKFKLATETLTLCVNNCGNPATNNICHKCFNSGIPILPKPSQSISQTSTSSATATALALSHNHVRDLKRPDRTSNSPPPAAAESTPAKRQVNRCSGCHRKVGLTGFRCRCGDLFCSDHRYSDRHDCTYDYKAVGRQAIARDNPLVKAPKILKL